MNKAKILDGTKLSAAKKEDIKIKIELAVQTSGKRPCLAVLLVGDDPASQVYVNHKERACSSVGIVSKTFRLPTSISQKELLKIIDELNLDPDVHGILPQLPMPFHIEKERVIFAINPAKDVDGLTPTNQGLLQWNGAGLFPCTPRGVVELLKSYEIKIEGAQASVLGRSVLVGSPVATMLSHLGATVVMIHKKTRNAQELCLNSDIIVSATGVKHLVKKTWVKKDAVVVDVGIHREESGKLTGDVAFPEVSEVASWITPVPGGVGPMTIAMLLENCFKAYQMQNP